MKATKHAAFPKARCNQQVRLGAGRVHPAVCWRWSCHATGWFRRVSAIAGVLAKVL